MGGGGHPVWGGGLRVWGGHPVLGGSFNLGGSSSLGGVHPVWGGSFNLGAVTQCGDGGDHPGMEDPFRLQPSRFGTHRRRHVSVPPPTEPRCKSPPPPPQSPPPHFLIDPSCFRVSGPLWKPWASPVTSAGRRGGSCRLKAPSSCATTAATPCATPTWCCSQVRPQAPGDTATPPVVPVSPRLTPPPPFLRPPRRLRLRFPPLLRAALRSRGRRRRRQQGPGAAPAQRRCLLEAAAGRAR